MNRAKQLAVAVLVAAAAAGCADPTDPTTSGLFYVVRNDTPDPVTMACDPGCGRPWWIAPRGEATVPTTGTQRGAGDMFVITDTTTHDQSYVFIFEPRDGDIFAVSAARPTEESAGAHHAPVVGRT